MTVSAPQLVSLIAVAIGAVLFVVSLRYINLADTIDDVLRLGFAFPAILVPGCGAAHEVRFLAERGWDVIGRASCRERVYSNV